MPRVLLLAVFALAVVVSSCGDVNEALHEVVEARRVAADLHLHFSQATDASNRAVMADTDDASMAFAKEAEAATQAANGDVTALRASLQGLRYSDELRLLDEFAQRFASYEAMDKQILDLASQNTNVKAQQLSFGAAQASVGAFRNALKNVAASDPARERWHVEALAATAVAAVREIQVLQAPHIAAPDDAAMTSMEKQMAAAEAEARTALTSLAPIVGASSRPRVSEAGVALNQFMATNATILTLSRRNTNVRSLALSLEQKRTLVKPCEDSLVALQAALSKRGYAGTR